jgi:anti-sigma factor RsiW
VKARVLHLDSDAHGAAQALLPWYVNGTLDAAEHAAVDAHLGDCARCRADLELQRLVRATPVASPPGDVDRGWLALRRRLEAEAAPKPPIASPVRRPAPRWLMPALALQAAFGVVLAAAWLAPPRVGDYRTLGAAPAAPANALVVFRADATEAEIRAALRAVDARIVGGPTVTDAYLLRLPASGAASLSRLRGERSVARAESLDGEPTR